MLPEFEHKQKRFHIAEVSTSEFIVLQHQILWWKNNTDACIVLLRTERSFCMLLMKIYLRFQQLIIKNMVDKLSLVNSLIWVLHCPFLHL